MSDLLHDDDLRTEREPVKEPAKRWRNMFRALRDGVCWMGSNCLSGDIVFGANVWPTAEIAETWALAGKDKPDRFGRRWRSDRFEYVGPFPVEGDQ